ncbi:MAG: mannonate dehydratase [Candidatus Latescibacterota bacterium]|jgi:mannonate dehydratase
MHIAMVLTPFNAHNLQLAKQIGVSEVVVRYPGNRVEDLEKLVEEAAQSEVKVSVVEGYLPIERIQLAQDGREEQLDELVQLVRAMAACGVGVLCYNWMALTDWTRTSLTTPGRGGALCTEFNRELAEEMGPIDAPERSEEQLWESLAWFLERILPVAEAEGVRLAMHPDDPPLSPLRGLRRIMTDVAAFERLLGMSESKANGICFCQGTFAEMGIDVAAAIRQFGERIFFAHVRDMRGTKEHFVETFHDDGQTDMFAAMCAYRDIGFDGVMRPDHVPALVGEEGEGGYTMQGRLFAVGYMRGLMEAAEKTAALRNG